MAFAGVRLDEIVWTRGAPKVFASSDVAERGFCPECGTPLTYRIRDRDRISVTIGSLDRPSAVAPEMQYGVEFEAAAARLDSVSAAAGYRDLSRSRRHRLPPTPRSRRLKANRGHAPLGETA